MRNGTSARYSFQSNAIEIDIKRNAHIAGFVIGPREECDADARWGVDTPCALGGNRRAGR